MAEHAPVMLEDGGCKVIVRADSISERGDRIITFEGSFERLILSEVNTHGRLARSSASTRAVPAARSIYNVMQQPALPVFMGENQPGMSASIELDEENKDIAIGLFNTHREITILTTVALNGGLETMLNAVPTKSENDIRMKEEIKEYVAALELKYKGLVLPALKGNKAVQKESSGRLLEPHSFHKIIITATELENFFALRIDQAAQPEFRRFASMMREARDLSTPSLVRDGEWHTPFITDSDISEVKKRYPDMATADILAKISVGRCARVSFRNHDGTRDVDLDIKKAEDLLAKGHMSPFDHVARPMLPKEARVKELWSRFDGWVPLRNGLRHQGRFDKIKEEMQKNAR